MVKQYIVVRKDLPMSKGKMSAQVSHGSFAFITHMMAKYISKANEDTYEINAMPIDVKLWDGWMSPASSFTKVTLAAKNKNHLEKVIEKAKAYGLVENEDFFCIRDEGRTELDAYREEDGHILTCVSFKPCEEELLKPVVGKLQLFRE